MQLNSESPYAQSRLEFCLALKAERERKGITLAEIANTTKIPASVFAALERNDLRRWPKGLFRRSFFRDYVRTIGLPAAETCAEFVRLFPDDEGAAVVKPASGVANDDATQAPVRLVLDSAWQGPRASVVSRLLAAGLDAGSVVVVSAAFAWLSGTDQLTTTAIVALAYFSLATVLLPESPGRLAISRYRGPLDALWQGLPAITAAWKRGVHAVSQVSGRAGAGTPEPVEEPELRTWIADAHRIAPSPRLRVRIKVS